MLAIELQIENPLFSAPQRCCSIAIWLFCFWWKYTHHYLSVYMFVSSLLVAYKIFLFIFSFQQFDHDVSQCYLASFLLLEIHWVYWILEWIFLIKLESCIVISPLNIFSLPSPPSLIFWGWSHTDFISVSQTGHTLSYLEILTLDFLST